MGLILDSSAIIAGERKGQSAADVLSGIRAVAGPELAALSVISVIELEHGIWRAKTAAQASARQKFMDDLFQAVPVYPLTFDIARLAARIGGEAQRKGAEIPFQDLVIGVTALAVQLRGCDPERPALPDDSRPGCKIPVVVKQGAHPSACRWFVQ